MNGEIIAFSGGIDSFLNVYRYLRDGVKPRLFYVDFGKPASRREIAAIKQIGLRNNLHVEIMPLRSITDLQNGYVDPVIIARDEADIKDLEISTLYGPNASGFHIILSLSSYYAQITNASSVTVGIISEQTKGENLLLDSLEAFGRHVSLLNPTLDEFLIKSPLIAMTKPQVIQQAIELGAPLEISWSCLYGNLMHCGKCPQCSSRKEAFESAGASDRTTYLE